MVTKVFIFDIDETLLSKSEKAHRVLNQVPRDPSGFSAYFFSPCVTLHRAEMTHLLKQIAGMGCCIGFLTRGSIKKERFRLFLKQEFEFDPGDKFIFGNVFDKTKKLKYISGFYGVPREEIVLIDNNTKATADALKNGFSIIDVDTNPHNETNGSLYLKAIESHVPDQHIGFLPEYETSDSDNAYHADNDFFSTRTKSEISLQEEEKHKNQFPW